MSLAQEITRKMGGNWHGNYGTYPGEGHSQRDRSVSIKDAPDKPEKVVLHCHAAGDWRAEMDRLRSAGLVDEFQPSQPRPAGKWRCTGEYEYDDGDGTILYRTRRLERDGEKKQFRAERFEDGKWQSGIKGVQRVPYRLGGMKRALAGAAILDRPFPTVYFTEGERKADKLIEWGFVATAVAFGANGGWQAELANHFYGATVVILPDNDQPGRQFAEKVKAGLEGVCERVVIVDLPGLPPKGDIMDWPGTAQDLRGLVDAALKGEDVTFASLDLVELARSRAQPKEFVIDRLAPVGEVTLLTGAGSSGKSLLAQQLATAAAAGIPCLGFKVTPSASLYLTCEDDADQLHWRQQHLCTALQVDMASLAGKLHLVSLRGALDNELATFAQDGTIRPAKAYRRLVSTIKATNARLVFLDNVAHLFTGNENDRGDVTRFVNLLNRLAGETNAAIILIGHPNKAGDDYSGSTGWSNAVRSRVFIEHDEGTDARSLRLPKANYARKGDQARFFWQDWAFVLEDDLPSDRARDMVQTQIAHADNERFLACLAELTRQERAVSEKANATNYAPKVFARMPEAKGITKERLEQAMERLFRLDKICRDKLWNGPDRKPQFGLREGCGTD